MRGPDLNLLQKPFNQSWGNTMQAINTKVLSALENVMVISTTDLQGNITYVNDLFCKLTGYTKEELLGQPHSVVRHPS